MKQTFEIADHVFWQEDSIATIVEVAEPTEETVDALFDAIERLTEGCVAYRLVVDLTQTQRPSIRN